MRCASLLAARTGAAGPFAFSPSLGDSGSAYASCPRDVQRPRWLMAACRWRAIITATGCGTPSAAGASSGPAGGGACPAAAARRARV
jgi:hypothetical protein